MKKLAVLAGLLTSLFVLAERGLSLWQVKETCKDQLRSLSEVHVDQMIHYRIALHECEEERSSCARSFEEISN